MNGSFSPDCCMTKCRLHFCAILMKVSHAMSWTPTPRINEPHGDNEERVKALTLMRLVHELEQLVYHRLEELPMRLEKPRVLAHDIHDITGNDSLVVLSPLHFD